MLKTLAACMLLALAQASVVHAATFTKAYLDRVGRVHALRVDGKQVRLAGARHATAVLLSPDGESVAWLPKMRPGLVSEVVVYRLGATHTLRCEPLIRDFWFWRDGTQIAIECGGLHFAGVEILYDAATLVEIDRVDQAAIPFDERPAWSRRDR